MDYNFTSKEELLLSEYINSLSNEAIYQQLKIKLKQIINSDNINNEQFKTLKSLIKSPQSLLNSNNDTIFNFLLSLSTTSTSTNTTNTTDTDNTIEKHEIFKPIYLNLALVEDVNSKIVKEENNNHNHNKNIIITSNNYYTCEIKQLIEKYKESQLQFIQQTIEQTKSNLKDSSNGSSGIDGNGIGEDNKFTKIFKECPLMISEDLEYREIKSLELSYDMVSYDNVDHTFTNRNECGTAYASIINNDDKIYCKVDTGAGLLRPAKENAIFQFYKYLFPSLPCVYLKPSQFIIINKLPILPEDINNDSVERKKLQKAKQLLSTNSTIEVYNHFPSLKQQILNSLKKSTVSLHCSLFIKGDNFESFLKQQPSNDKLVELIDSESFGVHILAGLLFIPYDQKPDKFIIQQGTNRIIGIDNDEFNFDEIKSSHNGECYINLKSILFTLEPLMSMTINSNVAKQFIQHQPNLFIMNWLLQIQSKNETYQSLLEIGITQKDIKHLSTSLELPCQFKNGWIVSLLERFKLIKSILESNLILQDNGTTTGTTLTYQKLFEIVFPTSSTYYKLLSKHTNGNSLQQIELLYNKTFSINQLFYKYLGEGEYKKSIDQIGSLNLKINSDYRNATNNQSILELIEYSELNDLLMKQPTGEDLLVWLKLLLIDKVVKIQELKLHYSFYSSSDTVKSILGILFKNGINKRNKGFKLVIEFIKLVNFNYAQELTSELLLSVISFNDTKNLIEQVKFLIKILKIDVNQVVNNMNALELSASNGQFELFKLLIENGAGKSSNHTTISKYYSTLSHDEKIELKQYLPILFISNPLIVWTISLNELLPLLIENDGGGTDGNDEIKIISTVFGERMMSVKLFNSLFTDSTCSIPLKSNEYGLRAVPTISDEYGNVIYIKFNPESINNEISSIKFSELLFGYSSPYCEQAIINDGNIQILLIQQVIQGEPLIDVLLNHPDTLQKLNSTSCSKQIILSILLNNSEGNLGNYLITPTGGNSNGEFNLISIDNERSFTVVSKQQQQPHINQVLFLFNQMKNPVDQDVIECFKDLDVIKFQMDWISNLKVYHQIAQYNFKCITFTKEIIKSLNSKLKQLKQLLNSKSKNTITHFEILESLEPLVADKYKSLLFNISGSGGIGSNPTTTILDRYNQLKKLGLTNYNDHSSKVLFTTSTTTTSASTASPNQSTVTDLINPDQALDELKSLNSGLNSFLSHFLN